MKPLRIGAASIAIATVVAGFATSTSAAAAGTAPSPGVGTRNTPKALPGASIKWANFDCVPYTPVCRGSMLQGIVTEKYNHAVVSSIDAAWGYAPGSLYNVRMIVIRRNTRGQQVWRYVPAVERKSSGWGRTLPRAYNAGPEGTICSYVVSNGIVKAQVCADVHR